MAQDNRFGIPGVPFPVGVEYYRPPTPKPEVWDEDFARLSAAGLRIVRSFPYWQWFEPSPGVYEMDDIDLLFDTAEKHGLYVWLDVPTATHGAGPDWLLRHYPDMQVVNYRNELVVQDAHPAYAQGAQVHCFDHPEFRRLAGDFLRHAINRYKDRPNLLIWGIWDGPNLSSAWAAQGEGFPCYCVHTLALYKAWLRKQFTLDELNAVFDRRFRRWEDVEPPRSNRNVVEMRWYRRFHHENIADYLKWMMDLANSIDPVHEKRAHGGWRPQPKDEYCAPLVDSWGMSMASNHLLTVDDPNLIADRALGFDWSRQVGRNGRWWNEEIYAGMSRGGVTWKKQSHPCEQTMLLWMTLIGGAAGAMFWQYRPEYLSFESPGYNMVALDGEPTPRFRAVVEALEQIEGLSDHLPLEAPRADVAIVYDAHSHELFQFGQQDERFHGRLSRRLPHALAAGHPGGPGDAQDGLVRLSAAGAAERGADGRCDARAPVAHAGREPGDAGAHRRQLRDLLAQRPVQLQPARGLRRPDRRAGGGLLGGHRDRHRERPQRPRDAARPGAHHHHLRLRPPRTPGLDRSHRPHRRSHRRRAQRRRPHHLVRPDPVGRLRRRRHTLPSCRRRSTTRA